VAEALHRWGSEQQHLLQYRLQYSAGREIAVVPNRRVARCGDRRAAPSKKTIDKNCHQAYRYTKVKHLLRVKRSTKLLNCSL